MVLPTLAHAVAQAFVADHPHTHKAYAGIGACRSSPPALRWSFAGSG
jgi:hypothetical protein